MMSGYYDHQLVQLMYLGELEPEDGPAVLRAYKSKWRTKSMQNDLGDLAEQLGAQHGQALQLRDAIQTLTQILQGRNPAQNRLAELQQQRNDLRDEMYRTRQLRQAAQGIGELAGRYGSKSLTSDPADLEADLAEREANLNWELTKVSAELCRSYGMCER